jgi:hypothetical protein
MMKRESQGATGKPSELIEVSLLDTLQIWLRDCISATKAWAWSFLFHFISFRDRRTTYIQLLGLETLSYCKFNLQIMYRGSGKPNNNDAIDIQKHATTLGPMSKSPTNLKTLPRPPKPPDPFVFSFLLFIFVPKGPVHPNRGFARTRIALLLRNPQATAIPLNCRYTMPSSVHGGDWPQWSLHGRV